MPGLRLPAVWWAGVQRRGLVQRRPRWGDSAVGLEQVVEVSPGDAELCGELLERAAAGMSGGELGQSRVNPRVELTGGTGGRTGVVQRESSGCASSAGGVRVVAPHGGGQFVGVEPKFL